MVKGEATRPKKMGLAAKLKTKTINRNGFQRSKLKPRNIMNPLKLNKKLRCRRRAQNLNMMSLRRKEIRHSTKINSGLRRTTTKTMENKKESIDPKDRSMNNMITQEEEVEEREGREEEAEGEAASRIVLNINIRTRRELIQTSSNKGRLRETYTKQVPRMGLPN
jgi:hypothetical protein